MSPPPLPDHLGAEQWSGAASQGSDVRPQAGQRDPFGEGRSAGLGLQLDSATPLLCDVGQGLIGLVEGSPGWTGEGICLAPGLEASP